MSDHARKPCYGLASRSMGRQNSMMIEAMIFLVFGKFNNSTLLDIFYIRHKL